ncbi:MAG: WD40 repeat domain-containing protein [Chloroflexota bacterium]
MYRVHILRLTLIGVALVVIMGLSIHLTKTKALFLGTQYCKVMGFREKNGVRDIAWSPSMKFLASTSFQSINIWDINTGKVSKNLTNDNFIQIDSLAWSPDEKLIATLGNGITVLKSEDGELIDIFKDGQNAANGGNVDWNFDGTKLAFIRVGENGHQAEIWDRKLGDIKKVGLRLININSVKWSTIENKIAISDGDRLQIWDVASDRLLTDFRSVWPTWAIAWSTNGQLLAGGNASYATNDSSIQIWDTTTNNPSKQLVKTLEGHSGGVVTVAWKPASKILASSSQDTTIRIWDIETGLTLYTLTEHKYPIASVKWSPDGNFLASADDDGRIIIWKQTVNCQ